MTCLDSTSRATAQRTDDSDERRSLLLGCGPPRPLPTRRAHDACPSTPDERKETTMPLTVEGPQDSDPPDIQLLIKAALRLREIVDDDTRDARDVVRAIDALGRALARLKTHIQAHAR